MRLQLRALVDANKMSVAFAIEHRPGTLVAALERLADAGVNLTKIESRPVPGSPWEYVFYVDVRFDTAEQADAALAALARTLPDGEGSGAVPRGGLANQA